MLDHPNIIKCRDCYIDVNSYYICTEFCEGGELHNIVKSEGMLPEFKTKRIIKSIISAVAYCHSKNIVHRDLNTHNILFRRPEQTDIAIIDFGDAKIVQDNTTYNDFVGTAFFISPESVRERKGWELKKSDI